jgi:hypothetical protein
MTDAQNDGEFAMFLFADLEAAIPSGDEIPISDLLPDDTQQQLRSLRQQLFGNPVTPTDTTTH